MDRWFTTSSESTRACTTRIMLLCDKIKLELRIEMVTREKSNDEEEIFAMFGKIY